MSINSIAIIDDVQNNQSCQYLIKEFESKGVAILNNYLTDQSVDDILLEIGDLSNVASMDLKQNWQNQKVCFFSTQKEHGVVPHQDFVNNPYFLQSRDKSHIFYEKIDNTYLINRIGHALHKERQYTNLCSLINNRMIQILKILNYQRPVCHLSVYIPKLGSGIGSYVRPHQENTFAYSEPNSALVLWIALEDAVIENGCLWGILGSNHWPLKYISKLDKYRKKRTFYHINDINIPDFDNQRELYTPLQVQKGDALIMHGNFVHASPINYSSQSRQCISLQFLETANTHYPHFNWLWPGRTDYLYDLT